MYQIKDKESILDNILERWELTKSKSSADSLPLRKSTMEVFKTLGLPGKKDEAYKYTPITKTLEKNFSFREENPKVSLSSEQIEKYFIPGLSGNVFVFVNGIYSEEHSTIISSKDQLEVRSIDDFYADGLEAITNEENILVPEDPFKALNTALADSGVYVRVPAGKIVEQPIIIYYLTDTTHGKVIQHTKNVILVGENSQVDIVECHLGEGEHPDFTNSNTIVLMKENAIATHHKIENENDTSLHVDNTIVHVAAKSTFSSFTISLSGKLIRNNLNISLNGEHSEANMDGLYVINGDQLVDNETTVDHKVPNCLSNELYKGIIDGKATGVFNGKIFVRPDAQKTNAFQSNKTILLSDDATINTKPQLEIWADDVKCSHGATTGQIDEEQLFYLRSRGLGKETARGILLHAFALDILDKIKLPALKDYLDNLITDRLLN